MKNLLIMLLFILSFSAAAGTKGGGGSENLKRDPFLLLRDLGNGMMQQKVYDVKQFDLNLSTNVYDVREVDKNLNLKRIQSFMLSDGRIIRKGFIKEFTSKVEDSNKFQDLLEAKTIFDKTFKKDQIIDVEVSEELQFL